MSSSDTELLPAGTPIDLANCEREPIHVPGSIQPRGVLLAVTEPDLVVEQVSENLADLVGVQPADALGRRLPDVLGVVATEALARSASAFGDLRERNPVEITLDVAGSPVPVDALLYRAVVGSGVAGTPMTALLVVELEPAHGPRPFSFPPEGTEDDVALVAVRLR